MENKITKQKLNKYFKITFAALREAKKKVIKGKEKYAKEIIDMVSNYLSDAEYFRKDRDYVNSFASLNYAHGWLDAGVRLDVFDVRNNKLFTVK